MIGNPPEYRKCTKEGHSNCKLKRLCLEKNCSSELICSECALDYHTSHAYNCKPIDQSKKLPVTYQNELDKAQVDFQNNIESINEQFQIIYKREKNNLDLIQALEKIQQKRYDLLENSNVVQLKNVENSEEPDINLNDNQINDFLQTIQQLNKTLKEQTKNIIKAKKQNNVILHQSQNGQENKKRPTRSINQKYSSTYINNLQKSKPSSTNQTID